MPEYLPGPGRPAAGPGFFPREDVLGRFRDRLFVGLFYAALKGSLRAYNDARRAFDLPPLATQEDFVGEYHRVSFAHLGILGTIAFEHNGKSLHIPVEEPMNPETLDRDVRRQVYDSTFTTGLPPLARDAAESLGVSEPDVRASFERLAAGRVLVLQEESREILMAAPFSAVPTPFVVEASGRRYYGNCVWDALGVLAMLKADGAIEASCGCCGTAMPLRVEGGALQPAAGVVHFAVPAKRWWEDIVFT